MCEARRPTSATSSPVNPLGVSVRCRHSTPAPWRLTSACPLRRIADGHLPGSAHPRTRGWSPSVASRSAGRPRLSRPVSLSDTARPRTRRSPSRSAPSERRSCRTPAIAVADGGRGDDPAVRDASPSVIPVVSGCSRPCDVGAPLTDPRCSPTWLWTHYEDDGTSRPTRASTSPSRARWSIGAPPRPRHRRVSKVDEQRRGSRRPRRQRRSGSQR
jgi:hypothetical protein